MAILVLGLVIFLGIHCVGFFPEWRARHVDRLGILLWKGIYGLIALVGFVLIVFGFQRARLDPVVLYTAPAWLGHLNALFSLAGFVLVAAAYVPGNRIKAKLGHPMVAGVKIWALGHLLAIGFLRDVLLFGAFLAWAIVAFALLRRRDRSAGVSQGAGSAKRDGIVVIVGVVLWALFAFWLHGSLIGVQPFG